MKPRIRSSIGIVKTDKGIEFFQGNIRKSQQIIMNQDIADLLCTLDGKRTIEEIVSDFSMDSKAATQFLVLIDYLISQSLIIDEETRILSEDRITYSRVFSMLEDYVGSEKELYKAWTRITSSTVLVIGLGAVGSWIAATLIQSGVKHLILVDNDNVEITNLHRQWGYCLSDVGRPKTIVLKERLLAMNSQLDIQVINAFLDGTFFQNYYKCFSPTLIIDCADKPTVDQTALWIGEYCMENLIPHIITGGYNLHLSLIGQTIIPLKTSCVKCFEMQLREKNEIETAKMRKLARPERKIGSLGPVCTLSASFSALEAVRVLSGVIPPVNVNRRGEFNIFSMDIQYNKYPKINNCPWCGKEGIYAKRTNENAGSLKC